jgi:hypothetical protein
MKPSYKAGLLNTCIIVSLVLLSLSVKAVERDGVKLSIGAFFSDIDSSIGSKLIGGNSDLEGQASFEADLRLQDTSTQPVLDLEWNFKNAHMLSLNYFSLDRKGSVINAKEMSIGDKEFKAGTRLDTQLDLNLWQLRYGYALHQTEAAEWTVTGGLHLIGFDIGFRGTVASDIGGGLTQDIQASTGFSNTIPLPNIGTYYTHTLAEQLNARLDVQYFDINIDSLDARMIAFDAGIEYFHTPQLSLYTGLSYYDVKALYTQDISANRDIEWDVELQYWGPQISMGYTF